MTEQTEDETNIDGNKDHEIQIENVCFTNTCNIYYY